MPEPWIGQWITEKRPEVVAYTVEGDSIVVFQRKDHPDARVYVICTDHVTQELIDQILAPGDDIDFIFNDERNAYYDGDVLDYCESYPVGIGNISDLCGAIAQKDPSGFIPKESKFILNGLRQHTHVRRVSRLNNRTYHVYRKDGSSVRILALNEYEITADALRDGIGTFGTPDVVLKSNPNGGITQSAHTAADSTGVEIRKWGELMGDLRRKWK